MCELPGFFFEAPYCRELVTRGGSVCLNILVDPDKWMTTFVRLPWSRLKEGVIKRKSSDVKDIEVVKNCQGCRMVNWDVAGMG